MQEGGSCPLMQMAKTSAALAVFEGLLYISVLTIPPPAAPPRFASLGDINSGRTPVFYNVGTSVC